MLHKKKTLLFVNGHLNTGGIEKTLVDLLSIIDYSKFDVDLLLFEGAGDYASQVPGEVRVLLVDLRKAYGPFTRVFKDSFHSGRGYLIYYRVIAYMAKLFGDSILSLLRPILPVRRNYYCAIAYRTGFCASVVAYPIHAEKKYCWWHNGHFTFTEQLNNQMSRAWRHFTKIVSVSNGCKEMLVNEFPDFAGKISVMNNVLNVKDIMKNTGSRPREIDPSIINIVSVGRLSSIKHFDNIIYVSKSLLQEHHCHFRWLIVGDGPEKDHLNSLIESNNLSDHVLMLGKKVNPFPYIAYADILVHPSYYEAHCTAILEAMALKTPCVVTKTVVRQDFTKDGVNCIEVDRSPEALLKGVITMINYPQNASFLVENAYSQVINDYSPEVISKQFYHLLES